MLWLYITLGVLIFLLAAIIFLIFPSGRQRKSAEYFKDKTFTAHRGLFENGTSAPENSLPAFSAAIEKGYGIELDVHLTKNKKLVVFHDDTTGRVCGENLRIAQSTSGELSSLRLLGTDEKIPSFDEFLSLAHGKVPLIIEIKGENMNTEVCEYTARALEGYAGEYCIESFNPFYVGWWKKHKPEIIRGQLSCKIKGGVGFARRVRDFLLGNLLLDFISRPDFVAYDIEGEKRISFRLARFLGAYPVAWTVRSGEQLEKAKKRFSAFIFEKPTFF